jgi:hypothetical protein
LGKTKLSPAYTAHEFDAAPLGRVRSVEYDSEVHEETGAVIISFADDKMINLFLDDISFPMQQMVMKLIQATAQETMRLVFRDNFDPSADETIVARGIADRQVEAMTENIMSGFHEHLRSANSNQIIEIIDQMPKDEMATLVEALVELAALKKKVSTEIESIGGPVDVCVVSKGDGLIWIKRKHYFNLDKNLQYLYRRFGEVALVGGGSDDANR